VQTGFPAGLSLAASVRIEAHDRQGLERLLRYCARPPFAAERLEELDAQRLIYTSRGHELRFFEELEPQG
jgi:hypothetical protein